MKTDELIELLAHDAAPPRRFRPLFLAAIAGGTAITALSFFVLLGTRPDIAEAWETTRFLFKVVAAIVLAVAAGGLALAYGQPGVFSNRWRWLLLAVPVALFAAVFIELVTLPEKTWAVRAIGQNARHCLVLIPLLSIAPFVCAFYAMRHSAPENPGVAGATAGLAAGAIGAAFYALNCPDDSPLFVAIWYTIAIAAVSGAGYLLGRRLLRW